jgi:uncharacterized damage-inducible protein DinB
MEIAAALMEAWDEAHWEFTLAFEGLSDEDLWRRPHAGLLSIGELAGHVAYWQAVWTLGAGEDKPDLAKLPLQSPLVDHAFRYYTTNIKHPFSGGVGVATVLEELKRVHDAAKAALKGKSNDDPHPAHWGTWGKLIQYQVFHVAYHCGQAFSVRHLMGHTTNDN